MKHTRQHIVDTILYPETGPLDVTVFVDSLGYTTVELGSSMTLRLSESDVMELVHILESALNSIPMQDEDSVQRARQAAMEAPNNV
jgi:hypothetical protein